MHLDRLTPVSLSERIELLDVLRGLAVCGILIGNMQWFSGYGMMPPDLTANLPYYDHVTRFLVHFFVEGKFYSIFSFLFGFGFALQIARAEERDDNNAGLFKRRLFWLLVIGLLHAYLLWAGDILSVYAVMGFILILFRRKSEQSLLKWTFWLVLVPVFTYILLYALFMMFVPPNALAEFEAGQTAFWAQSFQQVTQGSYLEIVSGYNLQYAFGRYAGLILQMRLPKILAMFLLGMYFYRRSVFQKPEENSSFIRNVMIYGLALGVVGNILMASLAGNEAPFPPSATAIIGVIGYAIGVPAMALGIIATVTWLWHQAVWQKLLAMLAPVGRMALTNYLLQTVICVTIFYGYGFGQYGKVGAARATLIALLIFAGQILFSRTWLSYFAYGPIEWIWRQLTYGKRLRIRQATAGA